MPCPVCGYDLDEMGGESVSALILNLFATSTNAYNVQFGPSSWKGGLPRDTVAQKRSMLL